MGYELNLDDYYKKYYLGDYGDHDVIDEDYDPFYDEEKEREEEARAFESIPKHGVHAHAYNKKLDNLKIKRLRKKGYTYREIAKQLKCSPSTVRNRLKKLGEE